VNPKSIVINLAQLCCEIISRSWVLFCNQIIEKNNFNHKKNAGKVQNPASVSIKNKLYFTYSSKFLV
jgi:hypothetical protein